MGKKILQITGKMTILVVVFLCSLVISSKILNHEDLGKTAAMDTASFPVVTMLVSGVEVNELHGYVTDMEANYMRDTITPLPEDRKLSVMIRKYSTDITKVSYEVRSMDTTRLVEKTDVDNLVDTGDSISATFHIKNLLEENCEYILKTIVQTKEKETIYYYTRIILNNNLHVAEQIDFMTDFHNKTFDKEGAKELVRYLESNSEGNNSSFHKVNIHSSFQQVTWGNLDVKVVQAPIPELKEINESTASMVLEYQANVENSAGEVETYNIREFYRVRYTGQRMYLLDFERTMTQIFESSLNIFHENNIQLGITGTDVEWSMNKDGNVLAFVQEGELWSYNNTNGKLFLVYSFAQQESSDARAHYQQHNMKIVNVDESGSMDFMVYGYMNRGRHEGQVGVAVYHFDSITNTVEETVYIDSTKPYQILKEDLGQLCYVSADYKLYLMMNRVIYSIDLNTMEYTEVVSNLEEGTYVIAEDNKRIAWQKEQNFYDSQHIIIMDLDSGVQTELSAAEGERIRPLGFMGEDFIYGVARTSDFASDTAGNSVFPMYKVVIQNEENQPLKEYMQDGIYIKDATVQGTMIQLERMMKNGNVYEDTTADQIMSNLVNEAGKIALETITTEDKKQQLQFVFADKIIDTTPMILTPKEVIKEDEETLDLKITGTDTAKYYMYAKGSMQGVYLNEAEAVKAASENAGVVVDDQQRYVWQRYRKNKSVISGIEAVQAGSGDSGQAACLQAMLKYAGVSTDAAGLLAQGKKMQEILQENLPKGASVLDISGGTLDMALYYVGQGIPVLTKLDANTYVLITGYDELNTVVMNPRTGTTYRIGMNDSTAAFAGAGNVFITYIP